MDITLLINAAADNYTTAQNLAMSIRNKEVLLTKEELLQVQKIFCKWSFYFADQAESTSNEREKKNYTYLKNRFWKYYCSND